MFDPLILVFPLAALVGLALLGALYQVIGAAADKRRHPAPGRLVDVGGFRLHAYVLKPGGQKPDWQQGGGLRLVGNRTAPQIAGGPKVGGKSRPVVVLDAGLGGSVLDWCLVQLEVATFATVVAFDRAGNGWSEAGPAPRTSGRMVEELHTLLGRIGLKPPYVLVGYSIGGLNARLFAARYPGEVAGLVTIDASHEDETTDRFPAAYLAQLRAQPRRLHSLLIGTYLGLPRLLVRMNRFPKPTRAQVLRVPGPLRRAYVKLAIAPRSIRTLIAEISGIEADHAEIRAANASGAGGLGNRPVIVIRHEVPLPTEAAAGDSSAGAPAGGGNVERAFVATQEAVAALSTKGRVVVARPSGLDVGTRNVLLDEPRLIVGAIQEVVEAVRRR